MQEKPDEQNPLKLHTEHTTDAIEARLSSDIEHNYLGDFILGAIDGTVTTFAIVSGVAGAELSGLIALVLGVANLLGDGFSMGVGNYLKAKSDRQIVERARKQEEEHIKLVPEGEAEEVRQIFAKKGFKGGLLEQIVTVITNDKKLWVDTMIREEHGLQTDTPDPARAGIITFISFCLVGMVPLVPYMVYSNGNPIELFTISSIFTLMIFFIIGYSKGVFLRTSRILSGLETLFMGAGASLLAYTIGYLSRSLIH